MRISVNGIAQRKKLSFKYTEQIMQKLKKLENVRKSIDRKKSE